MIKRTLWMFIFLSLSTAGYALTGDMSVEGRLNVDGDINLNSLGHLILWDNSSTGAQLQVDSGIEIHGSLNNPVQIRNTSLLVGYDATGANYGANDLFVLGKQAIGSTETWASFDVRGKAVVGGAVAGESWGPWGGALLSVTGPVSESGPEVSPRAMYFVPRIHNDPSGGNFTAFEIKPWVADNITITQPMIDINLNKPILDTGATISHFASLNIKEHWNSANSTNILTGFPDIIIPDGHFNIYSASTKESYFAGFIGIGTAEPREELDVDGEVRITGAVKRGGWLMLRKGVDQAGFTGPLADISWEAQVRVDSDYYSHSTISNPEDITISETGWYRISYAVNAENMDTDNNQRTTIRTRVYDDGVEISGSRAYFYSRRGGLAEGEFGTNSNSFIAQITAGSVINVRTDAAQEDGGGWGASDSAYNISTESQITIERIE